MRKYNNAIHQGDVFELKREHLALIKRLNWYWDEGEYGAIAVEPKRPLGNSDVVGDVIEMLIDEFPTKYRMANCPNCGTYMDNDQLVEIATKLYGETYQAIMIICSMACSFKEVRLGLYKRVNDPFPYVHGYEFIAEVKGDQLC